MSQANSNMAKTRRGILGLGLIAGSVAITGPETADSRTTSNNNLQFLIEPNHQPNISKRELKKTVRAILEFLEASHPPGMTLSIWEANPRDMPFLEAHIHEIIRAIHVGVKENLSTYPTDPVLVAALLYNESRYSPLALSNAGALGIAQFMPDTAAEYGLQPLLRPNLWRRYRETKIAERKRRRGKKQALRKQFSLKRFTLDAVIEKTLTTGDVESLAAYQEFIQAEKAEKLLLDEYISSVRAKLTQHDYFSGGREIMERLDARTSYTAVSTAVKYIARRLEESAGMTTSAVASYNAGPSAVRVSNNRSVLYEYGNLPAYPETVRYVQRILAVYSELRQRMT